jgi:hypothetical protein
LSAEALAKVGWHTWAPHVANGRAPLE